MSERVKNTLFSCWILLSGRSAGCCLQGERRREAVKGGYKMVQRLTYALPAMLGAFPWSAWWVNRWTWDRWLGCQRLPGHRRRLGDPAWQKWTMVHVCEETPASGIEISTINLDHILSPKIFFRKKKETHSTWKENSNKSSWGDCYSKKRESRWEWFLSLSSVLIKIRLFPTWIFPHKMLCLLEATPVVRKWWYRPSLSP